MLIKILIAIAVFIVILCVVIALRPSTFHYERSIVISAPASSIYPYINDQHQWLNWSPWAKLDHNMKSSFEGAESGVGSVYAWDGNSDVGAGRSTVVANKPDEQVQFKLEFFRPFRGTNDVYFTMKPEGDKTRLTWSMDGPVPFMAKAVGLFMNCEKMCGDMFDKGLADLKKLAEAKVSSPAA